MKTVRHLIFGEAQTPEASRSLLISLLISCGILLGGMFWTWRLGNEANGLNHQLSHAQEGLAALRQNTQIRKAGKP